MLFVFHFVMESTLSLTITRTQLKKLRNLFIAQSHDTKHIVPYLLGLVACSACIIASFWVEAAAQALWMNWVSTRGWKMALIPPWSHSRDEKRGSFIRPPIHLWASFSLPLCPPCFPSHPDFCFTVMGSYYKTVTHLPTPFTQPPLTHIRCSLGYHSHALPIAAFSGSIDFGPNGENPNFTPALWGTLKEGF